MSLKSSRKYRNGYFYITIWMPGEFPKVGDRYEFKKYHGKEGALEFAKWAISIGREIGWY